MRLTEMKEVLASSQIQLTKSLGQNFLHDANQLRRIVEAAELTPSDQILEIGPGLGSLTESLLAEAGHILAIEKDRRLFDLLQRRFGAATKVTLLQDDALAYLRRQQSNWSEWTLVSNLPYSVASRILVELAETAGPPKRMVATLQMEVAQRVVAGPRDEHYGLLSLLLQLQYEPRGWFKIPAPCFFPAPEVDSACVTLLRRSQPLLTPQQTRTFTRLVKRSFSQRRKMMLKLLKDEWPAEALRATFDQLQISAQVRAEAVSLDQFVLLTRILDPSNHG
jgi:16S rRNA (adenine1518-N6/adenine1519-N6)-dimethyltransferase